MTAKLSRAAQTRATVLADLDIIKRACLRSPKSRVFLSNVKALGALTDGVEIIMKHQKLMLEVGLRWDFVDTSRGYAFVLPKQEQPRPRVGFMRPDSNATRPSDY